MHMQRRLRRKWVVGGTAAIAGAALLYKLYYSERIARAWRNYQKLSAALNSYNQAFIAGAEVSATISKDLQQFFQSDSTELPQSLRQLAHLCQAAETQAATKSIATATAQGVLSAANILPHAQSGKSQGQQASEMLDKVLGMLVSDKGQTLVTLAVSVAARTSTRTYCECIEQSAAAAKSSAEATGVLADSFLQQLLRFASTPEGERLCMLGVKNFTVNATEVYCEKLEGTSFWEDLFSALSKPEHRQVGSHMTRCFINELMNTWLKPSSPTSNTRDYRSCIDANALWCPCLLTKQELPNTSRDDADDIVNCRTPDAQQQHTDNQPNNRQLLSQSVQGTGKAAPADSQSAAPSTLTGPPSRQQSSLKLQAHTGPQWRGSLNDRCPSQASGQEQQQRPWYQIGNSAIVKEAIKVMRVPEGRMMLLSLSAIAVAEGIQTGYHGVKQMCTDSAGHSVALIDGGKVMGLSLRQLYAGLSVVVMLMLYVNGQRAALQPV